MVRVLYKYNMRTGFDFSGKNNFDNQRTWSIGCNHCKLHCGPECYW